MKKYIYILLVVLGIIFSGESLASPVAQSCGNFGGSAGGCAKCYKESEYVYGCNQYQSCNQYYGLNYLSDTMVNTGSLTKIMYSSPLARAGRVEFARLQNQTDWSLSSNDMFRIPSTFSPLYTGSTGIYYMLSGGSSVKWIETKPGSYIRLNSVSQGASRANPAYRVSFIPRTYDLISAGNLGPAVDHQQCLFIYSRFCGDGVRDDDRGEQCDDGNMNSGDGCSNTCQTEVTPVCNNLTVTPTSVVNGGSITYTCTGTNVSSYSIVARNPNGTIIASSTSAAGGLILPASPIGTYSISCFVNGQVTTPASCQKTVENTTVNEPICTNLTVTPTSVVNGGNVTYTCTGNNVSSYSVQFSRPDGTIFQTLATQNGSVTIPATPTGTYTAKCFVNGQVTTPATCQKTVENTTNPQPQIDIDKRDANSADLDGSIGNDTQTVTSGTAAVFKIRVTNNGTEDLRNLVLSDAVAPSCAGNVTLPSTYPNTWSNWSHGGIGNHSDNILQVGEWFEYTCNRANTTAPYTNSATVSATGVTSGISVNDTDPTPVLVTTPEAICTNLTVTPTSVVNGGNVTYTCTGNNVSSYSVQFSRPDGTIFQTLATQNGSVTIPATPTGTYTAKCFVNGQVTTPATCQKTVENTTVTPTCDNLNVSVSGTTVNYACTGTNVSNYRITQNGTQIGTSSTGTVNVGYGTFTFICYVNDSITSNACQKTITTTPNNPTPQIQVIKDDNDNHDDRQFLQNGGAATFTIVVKNPGTEALDTVNLTDVYAPECNRNSSQTQGMIVNVGNRDNRLDPGESFSYICVRNNVDQYTFPNNENRICVDGRGYISGIPVNSCDTTRIEFSGNVCQNLQVTQNGNQINAICGPSGNYRLFVLEGQRVVNTYQNNNGQFNFAVGDGNYKIVCVRDGEQTVQPNCQKTITATPKSNYCTMTSSTQFGGAPLRTKLDCRSNTFAQCQIRIMKDGKPWGNVADCYADMVFEEKGVYDATCIIGGEEQQSCSVRVQVDIMTVIRTGPFLPLLIIIALSTAGYLAYRRRKTV